MPVISNVSLLLFTAFVHLTLSVHPEKRLGEPPSESNRRLWGPASARRTFVGGRVWVKMLVQEKAWGAVENASRFWTEPKQTDFWVSSPSASAPRPVDGPSAQPHPAPQSQGYSRLSHCTASLSGSPVALHKTNLPKPRPPTCATDGRKPSREAGSVGLLSCPPNPP